MLHARPASKFLLLLLVLSIAAPAARAITDEEIFRQMRFNSINPGGRALGLGGAFIALADDATAAQANPAGLMQLAAPEFFIEERFIGQDETSSEEDVTLGFFAEFEFSSRNERRNVTTPTFFSYVIPWERLALGLSRQELMKTRVDVTSSADFTSFFASGTQWFGVGDASVEVTNWNASLAWRPVDWISFGATGTIAQLRIDSTVRNFILDRVGTFLCADPSGVGGGPIFCPDTDTNGVPDVQEGGASVEALEHPQSWYQTAIDDDDRDFTYSAGVLYMPIDQFSAGLVYRKGAEFDFEQTRTDGLSGSVEFGGFEKGMASFTHSFNLPDSYGLGLKWRPTQNWTVTADVIRIAYSDLLEGLLSEQNVLTGVVNPTTAGGQFATDFTLDDVTEIHAGVEYLFTEAKWPWSLRAGLFNDPDNVLRDRSDAFGAALEGRDDEFHYTVGVGVVVQQKFQADVAVSISELGDEGVVSFIHRF